VGKAVRWILWIFVPAAIGAELLHASASWIFLLSCVALLPLAGAIGHATEELSHRMGPAAGGLFNASFGNAAELIIAGMALSRGLTVVVKASLTGSILGNLLLVTGAAMMAGGWRKKSVRFSAGAAEAHVSQLTLAVSALLVPAFFAISAERGHHPELIGRVSLGVAAVLILTYGAGLLFAFRTHKHLFTAEGSAEPDRTSHWSAKKAVGVLLLSSSATAVVAEGLVGAVEQVGRQWGMTEVFLGVVLLAMVGNAAEHSTAVMLARKGKMDVALNVTMQSSLQIALFVAPVLVFLSYALGHPLDLVFTPLEIVALMVAVALVVVTTLNGETNWFEGFQLLAVYAILAIAFYFLPEESIRAISETPVP